MELQRRILSFGLLWGVSVETKYINNELKLKNESIKRECWCGSGTAIMVFTVCDAANRSIYPLVRCQRCGVHSLFPAPDDKILVASYDSDYYGATTRKFVGVIASVVGFFQLQRASLVAQYLPNKGRILDVGCGNAGFLKNIQRKGFTVEGTEWTDISAQRAMVESNISVHVGELLDLNLGDDRYDAVTLWHVFEHLRYPDKTLERVRRLLKDSGYLFLSLPNHGSWQARVFGKAWFHLDAPRHLFGFDKKSLTKILELSGFEIVQTSTFSLEQNPYGFVQSFLNFAGFPHNRAYGVMKSTALISTRLKLLDLFLVAILSIPGIVFSTISSCFGAGATMTIVARPIRDE